MKANNPRSEAPELESGGEAAAVYSGLRWSAFGQFASQLIRFGSSMWVARLIAPSDYGILAMATVITGLLNVCRDLGTTASIVQQRSLEPALLNSAFFINCAVGLIFSLTLLALGPLIGVAYGNEHVSPVVQVLGFSFLLSSLGLVDSAVLRRAMRFDLLAGTNVLTIALQGMAAIALAYYGWGVWALVIASITRAAVHSLVLRIASPWRFAWEFSWASLRGVLRFGSGVTGSQLVAYLTRNVDKLIVGRVLGAAPLGFYSMAFSFYLMPTELVTAILNRVLFPAMSRQQDRAEDLGRSLRRAVAGVALVACPAMIGLGVIAEPLIEAVLGEKWRAATPMVMILCPAAVFQAIGSTSGNVYLAKGRSDILFVWSIASAIVLTGATLIGVTWGVIGVAVAYGVGIVLLSCASLAVACRLLDLSVWSIVSSLRTYVVASLVMGLAVALCRWAMEQALFPNLGIVLVASVMGLCIYSGLMLVLKPPAVLDVLRVVDLRGMGAPQMSRAS